MHEIFVFLVPDLSSEGTLCHLVAVLCGHFNLGVQLGPGKVKVDGWGTTHNLCKKRKTGRLHFYCIHSENNVKNE